MCDPITGGLDPPVARSSEQVYSPGFSVFNGKGCCKTRATGEGKLGEVVMSDMIGEVDGTTFMIAGDAIIIKNKKILLAKRGKGVYHSYWCLPGGRIDINETLIEGVKREVLEETGLEIEVEHLLGVYDEIERDPRGRSVTAAYFCRIVGGEQTTNSEITEIEWFPLDKVPKLAFDHNKMVEDAIAKL